LDPGRGGGASAGRGPRIVIRLCRRGRTCARLPLFLAVGAALLAIAYAPWLSTALLALRG
jgi:hypothetical protein